MLKLRLAHQRLYTFIVGKPYVMQVITFYLLTFAVAVIAIPLMLVAEQMAGPGLTGPDKNKLMLGLVVAPLLETLVFQHWIFKLLERAPWKANKYPWIITISAILFGLSHDYNLRYIVFGISVGFILAYIYYFYRQNTAKAFWTTALVHCMRNATSSLLFYLLSTHA